MTLNYLKGGHEVHYWLFKSMYFHLTVEWGLISTANLVHVIMSSLKKEEKEEDKFIQEKIHCIFMLSTCLSTKTKLEILEAFIFFW